MSIKIHVIGPPFIEVDNDRLHLPLKKAEALIYYLAIEGRANREKLACLLWGEKDEISAYNNLRNALYLLRRYFPKDFIVSDRRTVSLGDATVDAGSIEHICDITLPLSKEICEQLLKGFDVPDSLEFEEWLLTARSQANEKIIDKLKLRVMSCYDAQDEDKLQEALEVLVKLDPFEEDYILELMDLYCRRGWLAKATTIFREYRVKLRSDVDIAPSNRAEDFFRRMLMSGSANTGAEPTPELFFHGREKEQELILDRVEKKPDAKIVIFIDGEPGVGKTYLINRMISLLKEDDSPVFSTMSCEVGLNYPYSSWNNLVFQAGLCADTKKIDIGEINPSLLAGIFPDFMNNKRLSYNADLVKMSERTPIVIGSYVGRLVDKAASGKRPMLVLEDLQWFDQQSLHLLDTFLATLVIPSIIFVTTRPEKSDYALRKFKHLESMGILDLIHISLKPFDKFETQSLCQMFLSKGQLESKDRDYVFRESEGLPLLVVEIIKTLRSNSEVELASGGLGAVMLARFGEVSEKHREFLRILSIFTNGAQINTISEIVKDINVSVTSVAEELLNKQLIKEIENIDGNVFLDFRHAKVRECVYNSIPSFQRKEYHRKAAEILNRNYSPHTWDPALSSTLCYHYTTAGLPANVLKQHLREMIFDITLNHDLFPMIQDNVLFSCKQPFSDRNDTEKKMDEVSDLLHTLNRMEPNNPEVLRMEASYLELRGGYLIGWGQYKEGRIFINRALHIAKGYSFYNIHIHCLQHIGHHFLQTDNWSSLLSCSREMLYLAHDEEREKYIGTALRFIGVAFQIKGDFIRSEKVLRRSIEVFEEQALIGKNYTLSILAAHCYIGESYHWQGMFEKAMAYFEYCTRVCEEKGFFWGCSHFHAHMADVAFDMNDMDKMYCHIYRGAELFEKCQGGRCGSILYSLKAIADARQGKYSDALCSLERGEMLSSPIRKKSWSSAHLMAKAYLSEMKEKGLLPDIFGRILIKPAKEYAAEAAEMYKQIPVPYRYKELVKRFDLSC